MTRQHSENLANVLSGSFTRRLFVNVFHGSERVLEDLPMVSWSLAGNLRAAVKTSGAGTVVFDSVAGESVVPVGTAGVLSPFRARLELVMEIAAGNFLERVTLGTFRITNSPMSRDVFADVGGVSQVVASHVEVSFLSRDESVRRRGFRFPEQPPSLSSCFAEIRRITGMPVEQTVPDKPIPASTVWEAKQGGRLEAVQALAAVLGGVAVVNSVGAWEVVPDVLGDPTVTLNLGEMGTVVDVGNEIDTDTVYNEVVGTFEDDNRNPIYAVASVNIGDLAVDGLYEPNTRYYSSPFVKTQSQANSAVASVLAQSIGSQQYGVPIQCHINPLPELGDVVELSGWVRPLVGRMVSFSMSDSSLMNVTLEVWRRL